MGSVAKSYITMRKGFLTYEAHIFSPYMRRSLVTKYVHIKSTTVYAPLGLSQPLSRQRVFPSPQKQGGGGTLACGWGVGGESQFRRGAYTVVLFICTYFVSLVIYDFASDPSEFPIICGKMCFLFYQCN